MVFQNMTLATQRSIGSGLRRWRILHRVKQTHAAELFGVTQSTISRWEAGVIEPEPEQRSAILEKIQARLSAPADRVLARLVAENPRGVHLICDLSHRLLAASPERLKEFSRDDLIGESLWPFATEEICAIENEIRDKGFTTGSAVTFETGSNDSTVVSIRPSTCQWSWMTLSDGAAVRLVETIAR